MTLAQLNKIKSSILSIDNMEDLNSLIETFNFQQKQIQKNAKAKFKVGQKVKFTDRSGSLVYGKISKINQKTIALRDDVNNINWKVSPSMLSIA